MSGEAHDNVAGTVVARMLGASTSLLCLSLADNDLDDEAGRELAGALKRNTTLTYLDVSHNRFGVQTEVAPPPRRSGRTSRAWPVVMAHVAMACVVMAV